MQVLWKAKQLRLQQAAKLGRDVTQEEVSQATGLAVSRISAIENNKTKGVEFDTLIRLAQFYQLHSVADLIEFRNGESKKLLAVSENGDSEENYEAEVEELLNEQVPLPLELFTHLLSPKTQEAQTCALSVGSTEDAAAKKNTAPPPPMQGAKQGNREIPQ